MSLCCADIETVSCITHSNEQSGLDTHCRAHAYRGSKVAAGASPDVGRPSC